MILERIKPLLNGDPVFVCHGFPMMIYPRHCATAGHMYLRFTIAEIGQDSGQQHGISVRMLKASRVGYIVYEDEFQIVAEPFADKGHGSSY
jgi:hypothetical protein